MDEFGLGGDDDDDDSDYEFGGADEALYDSAVDDIDEFRAASALNANSSLLVRNGESDLKKSYKEKGVRTPSRIVVT